MKHSTFIRECVDLVRQSGILLIMFFFVCVSILMPQHGYFKDVFCACVLLFVGFRWKIDKTSGWLLVFSFTFAMMSYIKGTYGGTTELISYIIAPLAFYRFGLFVAERNRSEGIFVTFFIITILLLGINIYIQTYLDMRSGYIVSIERRLGTDGNEIMLTATLLGSIVSLGFVGLSYFISSKSPFTSLKAWLFLWLSVASFFTVAHLVNRTGIVVLLLSVAAVVLYRIKGNAGKVVLALLAVVGVGYFLLSGDTFTNDILDAYTTREDDSEESALSGGGRFYRWIDAIGNLFTHPFGWTAKYAYVHNLWFDVARVAGAIPFFALLLATIKGNSYALKLFRIKGHTFIALIVALNVCFFFTCFVEPIMEGVSTYVYLYFMLWGFQKRYYELLQNDRIERLL